VCKDGDGWARYDPAASPIPVLAVLQSWWRSHAGEGLGVAEHPPLPLCVCISFGFPSVSAPFSQREQWYPKTEPCLAPQVPKPAPGA